MKLWIVNVLLFFSGYCVFAQVDNLFVTVGTNLYVPVNTAGKGIYPSIGHDKESDPKLLIGGFNIGAVAARNLNDKFSISGQINFIRSVYWDEPVILNVGPLQTDIIGVYSYASTDYFMGLGVKGMYKLTPSFFVGTGFGVHTLLSSSSRMTDPWPGNAMVKERISNHYYKTIMPMLPLEFGIQLKNILLQLRYEQGLLNRMKKDLSDYKKDNYGC